MNSPHWLTVKSEYFKRGDIIALFYEGKLCIAILLADIINSFNSVFLLIKNNVICLRLFKTERKLVNE
jgi:hypothetical protein